MSDLAQVLNAALLKPKSVSARHPHPAKKAKPVEAAIPPAPEKPKPGAVC
jgi:ATP-dependent Lon protease